MKTLITSVLILLSSLVFSQDPSIFLEGQVTDYFSPNPIKNPTLILFENGKIVSKTIGKSNGKWWFSLKPECFYILECVKEGMVSKKFIIDTRNINLEEDYSIYLQITLFKKIEDFGFEFFESPIAWSKYDQTVRNMSWNNDFTEQKLILYQLIMKEYIKSIGGYYRRKDLEFYFF